MNKRSKPQLSLFDNEETVIKKEIILRKGSSDSLKVTCWNVGNPSIERAEKQSEWLIHQDTDVLVLTECKDSRGCTHLSERLAAEGYHVLFSPPPQNEFGVMIASSYELVAQDSSLLIDFLPSRFASVFLSHPAVDNKIELLATYVPSRDASPEKIERKRRFTARLLSALAKPTSNNFRLFCGDLNVLEPNHVPHYSAFQLWEYEFYSSIINIGLVDAFRYTKPTEKEYSWVGRQGDGYRYDHIFVSKIVCKLIKDCYYLHEPRHQRLSDHSAIILDLNFR